MIRKIFFLCSLLLVAVSPLKAQDDPKAAGAAIDTIVRVFSEAEIVDRFVADIYKKFEKDTKKGPILAARIAKAYYNYVMVPGNPTPQYHRRDVPKALEYLNKAIALDPKYAQSYLVASDIFYNEAKIDTALIWLDKGIAENPTDSSLYIESAKLLAFSDPDAAVQKLMVLKERDSTFQVDLQLGRLYYRLYDKHGKLPMAEMATAYGRVFDSADRSKMTLYDMSYYCMGLQFANDLGSERFVKLYDVTNYGMEIFPKDFAMKHFHLLGCLNTEKWDDGLKTMDVMKAMPDSVKKFQTDDYLWYASCLAGAKHYKEAISQFEYVLSMDDVEENRRNQAQVAINNTIGKQVDELVDMGDYEQAVAIIEPAVQKTRDNGNQNDNLVNKFGRLYLTWASELNGTEKQDAIKKAVKVYAEGAEHSDLNASMFLYQCIQNCEAFDSETDYKNSYGLPYASKMIALLATKNDIDNAERARLVRAYQYMMRYEYFNGFVFQKKKKSKGVALEYAYNVLELDPTDALAQRFISVLGGK